MKISYNWLKTFIDIDLPLEDICHKLTMSGLEVEHVVKKETIKGGLRGLIVGEVLEVTKHPNADRLSLTRVSLGNDMVAPIVCGAPNVAQGQKVVVAPVGTTIYPLEGDPFQIKKAKIRGEVSEGMICAEDEIGLGTNHDGIMVLDSDLEVGTPVADLYDVEEDHQIEIAIIPNRGDAISHLGIARELQALTQKKYKKPATDSLVSVNTHKALIQIEDIKACPRYSGVVLTNVSVEESPAWLKNRLLSLDLKPINNVVDITNLICHEIGQPLHAFDYDKIKEGKIIVRRAKNEEKLVTLDEQKLELTSDDLVICDAEKPLALAGVMGGLDSGVTESTTRIFIESAYFDSAVIRKTAKKFGFNTDSSYRFERGTDPEIVPYALKRAANLVVDLATADVASDTEDVYPELLEPKQVELNFEALNAFIGHEIPKEDAISILQLLEIKVVANNGNKVMVEVPRYRPDVERPVDVYEELLRIYGFDNVPISPKVNYIPSVISNLAPNKIQSKIANYLASIGFNEIMNNSLVPSKWYSEDQLQKSVAMLNPLSQDMNTMRMDLLNSGLEAVSYNINRKNNDLKFFEFGKVYFKTENGYRENQVLQLTASGRKDQEHWSTANGNITAEQLLQVAEHILTKLNIPQKQVKKLVSVEHPTKAQLKQHQLKVAPVSVSINWDRCLELANSSITLKEVPVFPVVRRDLSLVLDKKVEYKEVEQIAKQSLNQILTRVNLFDVYEGKPLDDNQRSLSVAFFLYNPKKTMEDAEIDRYMDSLITKFEQKLGAVIRT
jgi:phenylalanyl-tRNA synthetase beta chain